MSEPFVPYNRSILEIKKWQRIQPNLKVGFTTRRGGTSQSPFHTFNLGLHVKDHHEDVISNRQTLAQTIGIPLSQWVSGVQVHGNHIKVVTSDDQGRGSYEFNDGIQGIDGFVTNKQDLLCTAFFADCVPLFFFDPKTKYIGIAHAGWKGTVKFISVQMIETLTSLGVNISDLLVCIGPCISGDMYEVDDRVIQYIPVKYRKNSVTTVENERYLLDLKQLNVEILLQSGVLRHNISITKYCTYSNAHLFFSHRRDQGKTGRMLGYIGYVESS